MKQIIDWIDAEQTLFLNLRFNLSFQDRLYFYQKLNGTEIDFILKQDWELIPIESKLNDKDIIPKSFHSFVEKYGNEIKVLYRTTKSRNFTREYKKSKKVIWRPFYSIMRGVD